MTAQLAKGTPLHLYPDLITPIAGPYIVESGTPLVSPGLAEDPQDRPVLVQLNVIRTYERVIFELQQQLLRYKLLVDQLRLHEHGLDDEASQISAPLNAASVNVIDSISLARIPETSILRAYEEEES